MKIKEALGVLEIMHYDKYLGLQSLVGRHKKGILITSKKEHGGNYRVGKRSCYHKLEEKSWSKQWFKPF